MMHVSESMMEVPYCIARKGQENEDAYSTDPLYAIPHVEQHGQTSPSIEASFSECQEPVSVKLETPPFQAKKEKENEDSCLTDPLYKIPHEQTYPNVEASLSEYQEPVSVKLEAPPFQAKMEQENGSYSSYPFCDIPPAKDHEQTHPSFEASVLEYQEPIMEISEKNTSPKQEETEDESVVSPHPKILNKLSDEMECASDILETSQMVLVKNEPISNDDSWHDNIEPKITSSEWMNFQNKENEEFDEDGVDMKISINNGSFVVKEESVSSDEFWAENIKCEEPSPPSMNTQSKESAEIEEHDIKMEEILVKEEEPDSQEDSILTCCSDREEYPLQVQAVGMNSPAHISEHSFSSGSGAVPDGRSTCQEAADRYMSEGQEGEILASVRLKYMDQSVGCSWANYQIFKCSHCGKSCSDSSSLTKHVHIHTGEHICSLCGKSFMHSSILSRHMLMHGIEGPFKCGQCGKDFRKKDKYDTHMRIHLDEKSFKCPECEKSFAYIQGLTAHLRTHSEQPYKCSQCGESFSNRSKLTTHMRIHKGEQSYECSLCGKSFKQSTSLAIHMLLHKNESPSKCCQCGKDFKKKGSLFKHMRTHIDEKPFKCSVCEESFAYIQGLTAHMHSHTGDRSS